MGSWPPVDDDTLLAELRVALREPREVPEEFLAAARSAYTWRTIDAELAVAELVFDSACDPEPAGLTRSSGSARTLTFRNGPVVIEIEVTSAGVTGQVSPAGGGGRVAVRSTDGDYDQSTLDSLGFFTLGTPPSGPVRLYASTSEYTIATSWVCLS